MPIRSTFRPTNISAPKKYTLEINKYKGVDYSAAKMNVADDHAIEIKNIIYKDKVNQKRNGWEQIGKAGTISYHIKNANGTYELKENTTNINGVWFLKIDSREYCIAHIGKLLFSISGIGRNKSFLDFELTPIGLTTDGEYKNVVSIELNDAKSSAFYGSKRLYILDGKNYLVLKPEADVPLNLVEDDDETYIPTTTIGITYKNSAVNSAAPLDDVNLMTQWRKNKLVSGTYVDDGVSLQKTQFWDYELDTAVIPKTKTDINDIEITISALEIPKEE